MFALSCSTQERLRPQPVKIFDCQQISRELLARDRFFNAVRGSAVIQGKDMSFDADIAARYPHELRVEISGPLGVKLGLLVMNQDWVKFVVPREKLIMQIPKSEVDKKSLRSERFLSAIVVPLPPESLVSAVTTQSALAKGAKMLSCRYEPKKNMYELRLADTLTKGGWLLSLDPTTLAPLEERVYESFLPDFDSEAINKYSYRVVFKELQGNGLATIPSKVSLWQGAKGGPISELIWVRVEAWADPQDSAFRFEHTAAFDVRNY